jgi:hypothetical protein
MQDMGREFLSLEWLGVSNTNVGFGTAQPSPIKPQIHNPDLCVYPRLVMPPEEFSTPEIRVVWSLCNEVDILFDWLMVISIQAIPWPSHYNNMISLDKVITKLL